MRTRTTRLFLFICMFIRARVQSALILGGALRLTQSILETDETESVQRVGMQLVLMLSHNSRNGK